MILVHPLIDPIFLSIGFFHLRWYSLAYILGFLIGYYLIKKINKHSLNPINNKIIENFFIWSVIGIIFGGRIGYILFYQTNTLFINPINILFIWEGGMSFHGGLIGIVVCIFIYSKLNNINFFQLSDLVSIVAPIGIFFGRVGNFINVELIGRPTEFFLSMIYPTIDNIPRHPSQIYEAFFEGLVLFLILMMIFKYILNKKHGIFSSIFLIFYSLFRFFLEFLREPDSHLGLFFDYFTLGQFLCIPMFIIGILIYLKTKHE